MRRSALIIALALACAAAALPAGARLAGALVSVKDKRGDPEDGNYRRYPKLRNLDLTRVTVSRSGRALRVTWETAAPPARSQLYTFAYYDARGASGGTADVRFRADGTRVAWVS